MVDVDKFVKKTLSLLNIERKAEVDQARAFQDNFSLSELQRRGICLLKLRVRSRCTGLYGRSLLTFESARHGCEGKLPAHRITPGDIVGVSLSGASGKTDELCSGIVTRVTQTGVTVAFDESADTLEIDDEGPLRLSKLANDITYKRIKSAMGGLSKFRGGPSSHLIDVLFGNAALGPSLQSKYFDESSDGDEAIHVGMRLFNPCLDQSQREAVSFALRQREVAVIHGPPGTGKTTTVVEIILQAVKNLGMKVLACAPSNIAVDNMVEKLARGKAKVVRIGHPARLLTAIQQYSLDAILASSDATTIVQDVRKDIDSVMSKTRKCKGAERRQLRQEIKTLRKELREREDKAMREILTSAEVVLATNTSASDAGPLGRVKEGHFDLVVIDEAAQALEASCWIPLLKAPRCILAGDHHQLPPTIISAKAARDGLEVTLMERIVSQYRDKVVHMLTTQYRMHEAIMKWSSEQLYNGRLQAHLSVKHHLLQDLPGVHETDATSIPLLLIDTTGCDVMEMEIEDEMSKGNEGEADIVAAHVTALITAGLDASDIAVIAPYNLQVDLLRARLSTKYPSLEIKSVDGFQGREKEAVIISLVRSNKKGEVGFLAEDRRINVAITRARRHLAIICDSETVSHHEFLKSLVDYMGNQGEVRSAVEYLDGCTVTGDASALEIGSLASHGSRGFQGNLQKLKGKSCEKRVKENQKYMNDISVAGNSSFVGVREIKETKESMSSNELFSAHKSNVKSTDVIREPKSLRDLAGDYVPCVAVESIGTSQETSQVLLNDSSAPKAVALEEKCTKNATKNIQRSRTNGEFVEREARKILTREELEDEIRTFLTDKKRTELEFSTSLTFQERFFVHSIAEELGTGHESRGEGHQRYITVRKMAKPVIRKEKDDVILSTCPICKKCLPTHNLELHLLRCEQRQRQREKNPEEIWSTERTGYEPKDTKNKPIRKNKTKSSSTHASKENDEDLDAMISEFTKKDSRCAFESCKKSISMLGQKCLCCTKVYCLSHHIPEVHGCGEDAKINARKQLGKAQHGKPKRVDPTRKSQLQRKLENKLDDMEEKRKPKKKDDKN